MKEMSQKELAKVDRITSQNDVCEYAKTSEETKDGKGYRRKVQKPSGQTSMPERVSAGDVCQATDKSKGNPPSSRRGKLSLRQDASRHSNSNKHMAAQSKAPTEVMKAILGETTLNQSSDFKEPSGCGSFQEARRRRRVGSSLSKPKPNKSRKTVSTSDSNSRSNPECKDHNEPIAGDKKRVQSFGSSSEVDTKDCEDNFRKSPIKACSIYISKLKFTEESLSPTKLPNKAVTVHKAHSATRLPHCGVANHNNKAQEVSTLPIPADVNARNKPPPLLSTEVQDQGEDNAPKCPVCEKAFPAGDAAENHIQRCLRQRFTKSVKACDVAGNSDDTSGDEEFARQLQRREEEKLREEMLTDSEKFFCQICQRELSHMNSTRRTQHMNRCMDSIEAVKPPRIPTTGGYQPPIRNVPDCPICGKHFKTTKQRESHLKKCARENRVSPQQLIALVRVQEETPPGGEDALQGTVGGVTRGANGCAVGGSLGGAMGGTTGGAVGGTTGGAVGGTTGGAVGGTTGGTVGGRGATGGAVGGTTEGATAGATAGASGGTKGCAMGGTTGCAMGGTTGGAMRGDTGHLSGAIDAGTSAGVSVTSTGNIGVAKTVDSEEATGDGRETTLGSASGPRSLGLNVASRGRSGGGTRGRKSTRGRGRQKHPRPVATEPLDEETQVALALSASLIQQLDAGRSTEGTVGQSSTTAVNPLNPPGKPVCKKRTGKKDAHTKEVPLLLRRTNEEHKNILGIRIADIILPREDALIQKTPRMKRSKVASRYGHKSPRKPRTCIHLAEAAAAVTQQVNSDKNHRDFAKESSSSEEQTKTQAVPLWSLASASDSSSQMPFYVHRLLPAVTPQKRKSSRPVHVSLRHTTPRKHSQEEPRQQKSVAEMTQPVSASSSTNVSLGSQEGSATQALGRTVQILADLAAESGPYPYTQTSDSSLVAASGFIPTEAELEEKEESNDEGQEESMIAVNHHQLEILHSLSELVNSEELSDLHLVTCDGSLLYAHQFMIKLRCPSLAELIEESPSCSRSQAKRLNLQDFSRGAVLCALDFIYAGKVTVTSSSAMKVWQFAKRFSLLKLSDFCHKLCHKDGNSTTVSRPDERTPSSERCPGLRRENVEDLGQENEEFFANKGLEDLIQSLWDSSGEESGGDHKEDDANTDDNDSDNNIKPTPETKRRFSHQVSDTESDNEGKDSAPDDKDLDEIYDFFSTQRQRRNACKSDDQVDDTSDGDSQEGPADDEKEEDDDYDKENSENVAAKCRRRSFTIVEQLQSSCRFQNKRSLMDKDPVLSPGDAVSKHLKDCVTPETTSNRRKCYESSSNDLIDSSPDVITPCFVHVEKLSNDLPVSPFKENLSTLTVGACLENQCNLTIGQAANRKQKVIVKARELQKKDCPDEDHSILKGVDATLADVGDSIFQSRSEGEEDIEMMDISRSWKSDRPTHGRLQEMDLASDEESPRMDTEGDQPTFNQSEDLLRCSSEEREEDSRHVDVDSHRNVPSVDRGFAGSSGTEDESLPLVNIRSQPDKLQVSKSLGHGISSNHAIASEDSISSDERLEQNISEGARDDSQHSVDDEVIDLSQDEDQENVVVSEDDRTDDGKETVQDKKDEDISRNATKSPASVSSRIKTVSVPPKTCHPSNKSSRGKPPMIRSQKFTFRRRVRQAFNTTRTPAIRNKDNVKPQALDTLNIVTETPAAFRAASVLIRDSSTPMFGHGVGMISQHSGCNSPKVSPVRDGTDDVNQRKVETVGGLKGQSTEPLEIMSSVSPRRKINKTLSRGTVNDGSPLSKSPTKNFLTGNVKDAGNTNSGELRIAGESKDACFLPSPMSKFAVTSEDNSEQEDSGPDSPSLSGTPIRPTPDCFDADTPEIISSIPPARLSPSPPPSPTFGSARCPKQKDTASPSLVHHSVDDTIVNEVDTSEESFTLRGKRKLHNEEFGLEDVEVPSKRCKSLASQLSPHSIMNTNLLSPACTTDEDDVLLVANEEENEGFPSRNNKTNRSVTVTSEGVSWPDQLCVGLSPTRYSPESVSDVEEVIDGDVSVFASCESSRDASTRRIQVDKAPVGQEPTSCPQQQSLPVAPVTISRHTNSRTSPRTPSEPTSRSPSPIRIRYYGDDINQIKPQAAASPQTSTSDVETIPALSPQNVSEDQFAYFGDDGGGYMDDFNFCSDREMGMDGADPNEMPSEKSQPQKEMNMPKFGGGAVSLLDKPCPTKPNTTKPTTLKSASLDSKGHRGNISIRTFSSSDEDASSPRLISRPASRGDSADILSESAQLLRNEAEEFGCSESFLCELKAGNVDEETAWGGVGRIGGGLEVKQSKKEKKSQVCKRVAETPAVNRKQLMSREVIDELYHPPAPVTPMPPYDDMNTPGLKNALKTFGVKPLPKKKARLKLKEIYCFTHQVLEDSDSDTDKSGPVTVKLPSSAATKPTLSKPSSLRALSKKSPSQEGKESKTKPRSRGHLDHQEVEAGRGTGGLESDDSGRSHSGDSDDSEYGNSKECPEGNEEDDDEDEDYLEPSQRTCANLEEAIKVYIKSKTSLYEKILHYEPLDLDKFHAELKNAGIKYSKNKLREFLDYHGITFRVLTKNINRHVRKPKKPKPKTK